MEDTTMSCGSATTLTSRVQARAPSSVSAKQKAGHDSSSRRTIAKSSKRNMAVMPSAARGHQRQSLAARSEERLIGRRVRLPYPEGFVGESRTGKITAVANGRCLIDVIDATGGDAQPAEAQPSLLSALRWAAMASTDEAAQLPGQLHGMRVTAQSGPEAVATSATDTVTTAADMIWPCDGWHPTWRVRRWLLPDVDGLAELLERTASASGAPSVEASASGLGEDAATVHIT